MLKITIPSSEAYDETKEEFVYYKEEILHLEHSLVSISKWESKWNKPFLSSSDKSVEEILDYVRCMSDDEELDYTTLVRMSSENIETINNYINAPMTATTFTDLSKKGGREIITSEIVYYWMIALNIPFECQWWHLNRLLTLIRVCNLKNNPPKKMSKSEVMARNKALNEARKKEYNTRG